MVNCYYIFQDDSNKFLIEEASPASTISSNGQFQFRLKTVKNAKKAQLEADAVKKPRKPKVGMMRKKSLDFEISAFVFTVTRPALPGLAFRGKEGTFDLWWNWR